MPNYRRVLIPGGTYFFTVNLLERKSTFLTDNIASYEAAWLKTKRTLPFRTEALVILPDHIHAVLTLPEGDADFPARWRLIKSRFSRSIPKTEWRSDTRKSRKERGIWQRRYWEHHIRDPADFAHHVAYCYWNPVKHGYVECIADWPHSTYHRDIRCGRFAPDQEFTFENIRFGERND